MLLIGLVTDAHTDDTDAEGSIKDMDDVGDWSNKVLTQRRYDSSAIPGTIYVSALCFQLFIGVQLKLRHFFLSFYPFRVLYLAFLLKNVSSQI